MEMEAKNEGIIGGNVGAKVRLYEKGPHVDVRGTMDMCIRIKGLLHPLSSLPRMLIENIKYTLSTLALYAVPNTL